jgi:hypothetical protein
MTDVTWVDYKEAGMPYGKTGFVRWLKEQYEAKLDIARTALLGIRDTPINGWNPDECWVRALDMKTQAREALDQGI